MEANTLYQLKALYRTVEEMSYPLGLGCTRRHSCLDLMAGSIALGQEQGFLNCYLLYRGGSPDFVDCSSCWIRSDLENADLCSVFMRAVANRTVLVAVENTASSFIEAVAECLEPVCYGVACDREQEEEEAGRNL